MNASSDRRPAKGTGRVNFIAHYSEIIADLDAGRTIKAVFEKHRGRVGISYPQFARYVARYVRRRVPGQLSLALPPPAAPPDPGGTPSDEGSHGATGAPQIAGRDPAARPADRRPPVGGD